MFTYIIKVTINRTINDQLTVKAETCKAAMAAAKKEKMIRAMDDVVIRVYQPGCAIADLAARKSCGHWKNY